MLKILFPFKLYLTVFQLEEYKIFRFYRWLIRNFFVRDIPKKKGLVITQKIKLIILLSVFWEFVFLFINPILFLVALVQPYVLYTLSIFTLKPYEIWNRKKVIKNTRNKIDSFGELKIIGITGSYGKTSVKEILYQILKDYKKTLRTPESYNTVFGVSKVVDLELDKSYEFFICEMGAYKQGEIKELCEMVNPDFGIITGITEQHLERFKNLKNIKKTKFELFDWVKKKENFVFNINDKNILEELERRKITQKKRVKIDKVSFSNNGMKFNVYINNKKSEISNKLFGFQNVENIKVAVEAALKLGLSKNELLESIKNLKPFSNRFVIRQIDNSVIVDNTYNSNHKGFLETIRTAKVIIGKKALVTPGLVELGKMEGKIHMEIGEEMGDAFEKIVLVGKNNRTESLKKGIGNNKKIEFISDNRGEYNKVISDLVSKKYDWIFLENDIPENY